MQTIQQTHDYDAGPETLFAHLTDAAKLNAWWTTSARSDARAGGAFRYEWNVTDEARAGGKEDHAQEGTYTVFEPGRALAYPWQVGATTQVRFDLAPRGKGTRLTLTHTGVPPNDELVQMLTGGWDFFLGNLRSVLGGGPDARAQMGLAVPVSA